MHTNYKNNSQPSQSANTQSLQQTKEKSTSYNYSIINNIANASILLQKTINPIYKYFTEFNVTSLNENTDTVLIDDNLDNDIRLAIAYNQANKLKEILYSHKKILAKVLFHDDYQSPIRHIFIDNKEECMDVFFKWAFEQNKINLLPKYTHGKSFIYACRHLEEPYSTEIIDLCRTTEILFNESLIGKINNLYLNKSLLKAVNETISIENRIKTKQLFHSKYCNKQEEIFKHIDYLDLAILSLATKQEDIFIDVCRVLSKLDSIAIYLSAECYKQEEQGEIFSFGDENACVNILNQLIFLGLKRIVVYISSPDHSDQIDRKNFTDNGWRKYQTKKDFVMKKLSYLIDGLDATIKTPQRLIKDGCTIDIEFIDAQSNPLIYSKNITLYDHTQCFWSSIINENLLLVFDENSLEINTLNFNNRLTLLPFKWKKNLEKIKLAKSITIPYAKNIPLNNPSYSILREQKQVLPMNCTKTHDNEKWMLDLLVNCNSQSSATTIAALINEISVNTKNKTIHHSVAYGLHHPQVNEYIINILNTWISALNTLSSTEKKPVVLSIVAHTLKIDKKQFAKNENIVVFDLCQEDHDFNEINLSCKQPKTIIIFYPALPKPIFDYLIDHATFPILVEGANTTSYALQAGIPFLSVLPTGNTPIPTKMGDPWQAFLHEFLSHKLAGNTDYLKNLKLLFEEVVNKRYKNAIDLIYSLKDSFADDSKLSFLWKENPINSLETNQITLLFLLKKGNDLSEMGYKYLLQALDPDLNSIANYVQKCTQTDSRESQHFELMKHHVNLVINDNLTISLHKFFNKIRSMDN